MSEQLHKLNRVWIIVKIYTVLIDDLDKPRLTHSTCHQKFLARAGLDYSYIHTH